MRFVLNASFSYELTNKSHQEPLVNLENQLNVFFENKTYGKGLTTLYCDIICVSPGFDQFFMVRRPKWSSKNSDLKLDVKIDFDTYSSMDGNDTDRLDYLSLECYKTIQDCFALKLLLIRE